MQTNNKDTFTLPILNPIYSIDSVKWDFGDGLDSVEYSTAISSSMPHSYLFSGNYIVCLNVWLSEVGNPIPIFCTSCDTIDIPCQVNFIADTSGNTITANELNSILPGPITSYSWDYGDSTIHDTTSSIYHAYDTVGNYNLCLTIQGMTPLGNPYQCSACSTIQITKSCHIKSLIYNSNQNGKNLTLNNYTQNIGSCFIRADSLDFGDGTYVLNFPFSGVTHTYAQLGNYNVCLYCTGYVFGGSIVRDTFCLPISIHYDCGVKAEWSYQELDGLTVKFTDSSIKSAGCSIGTGNSFDFGDGGVAFTQSILSSTIDCYAMHTYSNPGVYKVCLVTEGHKFGQGSVYNTLCKLIQIESSITKKESILSIYPNPVNNILTVVFPLNEIGLPQQMMVSDITGRIISNQQYVPDLKGEIQIDFRQFTKGIYFVFNHVANKSRKQFKVRKE